MSSFSDASDVTADTLLSATQLAKLTRASGPTASFRHTLYRWIRKGVLIAGQKVKLRAIREGGRWRVRWGDFVEFRQRCSTAAGIEEPRILSAAERKRKHQATEAELDAIFASLKTKKTA